MNLTKDQKIALDEIIAFIKSKEIAHTLRGYAGTGKSFLTKYIFNWTSENQIIVAGIAPTHKAKKVLENILNQNSFVPVTTMTVASFLNKIKQHSYVGAKNYNGTGKKSKASYFDLFIVDECSMIADKDVNEIIEHVKTNKKKVLFIGDNAQIANPNQTFVKNEDGTISKKDSNAFDFPTSILTTIIRQDNTNPLLDIYTALRLDLFKEPEISRQNKIINEKGVKFYQDSERFLNKIRRDINKNVSLLKYKVITYTNESVRTYNKFIRDVLNFTEKFVLDDILMGYNNVGFPDPIIENGQEYIITHIKKVTDHLISNYNEKFICKGIIIRCKVVGKESEITLFFPEITSNIELFTKLKNLANQVNKKGSSPDDFKKYSRLKNQLCFMENIYDYYGSVMSESSMREMHPKLFNNVSYYLTNVSGKIVINSSKYVDKINNLYPGLLESRISDNKMFTDSERLVDKFQIIEKDIDYGYAITAHKAQGSTYHTVYIDELDFNKIGNKWNPYYDREENGTKEKNQLKYVAYTRPTHMAIVLY